MSTPARIDLKVHDDSGEPSPFRADVWMSDGRVERIWSGDGRAQAEVPAGATTVVVRRGISYDAVELSLDLRAGDAASREVTLRQRFSPREMGWYGGENHMHVLHGKNDPARTIADGGRMAAADGLEYLQLAYGWNKNFDWLPAAELERQCAEATRPDAVVGWNIESPKCYMSFDDGGKSGNLHCYGHGWTVGLKDNSLGRDFFHTGPNFRIIQEIQRQGGVVGLAHPVRASFRDGNFVSNWASELPFDFVAGAPYAAVDILNDSPLLFFESERCWYTLLNLGYKVAGTGNSDGALGMNTGLGRYRTYTSMPGAFSWEGLADGMRAGHCIATSGPFVLFEVDGEGPGAEFAADGRVRRATIKAWSAPLPGETLVSVQIVRNGEVVRAWDIRELKARFWETSFEVGDKEFAWYCVRVLSTCTDRVSQRNWGPQVYELAVANPVFFLPNGFARPEAQPANLRLRVLDSHQQPLKATVDVVIASRSIAKHEIDGEAVLTIPATAFLKISSPGHESVERNLYTHCPEIYNFCHNLGTVWPSFFSPETYRTMRERLRNLKMDVRLSSTGRAS
jgi:hypothetical protein